MSQVQPCKIQDCHNSAAANPIFCHMTPHYSEIISWCFKGSHCLHFWYPSWPRRTSPSVQAEQKKISFGCLPPRSTTIFQNIRSYSSNEYSITFPEDLKLRTRHHERMKPITRDHRAVVCHDSLTSECLKWQSVSQALSVLQSTCISHNSAWNLSSATVLTLCCITL
jgi:hypothetical protein